MNVHMSTSKNNQCMPNDDPVSCETSSKSTEKKSTISCGEHKEATGIPPANIVPLPKAEMNDKRKRKAKRSEILTSVTISPGHLTTEAEDTADLLLFMDRFFDSVNGSSPVPIKGKKLRCAVTKKSEHEKFWKIAIKVSYKCPEINHDVPADSPQSYETCSCATAPRNEVVGPQSRIAVAAQTYVTGFISKKIFALTKDCETCKGELMSQQEQPQHEFIVARR
uniref:Uncharacterized protein n=1 Tax=Timema genevievae TaxID=629358 RepID=A0A7R9K9V1_TIMGE|nr:unnamed protein product [Timema genevievae]